MLCKILHNYRSYVQNNKFFKIKKKKQIHNRFFPIINKEIKF